MKGQLQQFVHEATALKRTVANSEERLERQEHAAAALNRTFEARKDALSAQLDTFDRRLERVNVRSEQAHPALAADKMEPFVVKLFGREAASGTRGGTWTWVRHDGRTFALSVLHAVNVSSTDKPPTFHMQLPEPIWRAATAVGLFERALETFTPEGYPPPQLDVVMVEVDPARLTRGAFDRAFQLSLPGADARRIPRGTSVVGWSEQMALSGRTLGVAGGLVHFAVSDGCVTGNNGTLVVPVANGTLSAHPVGVYFGGSTEKRGIVVPLPRCVPAPVSLLRGAAKAAVDSKCRDSRGAFSVVSCARDDGVLPGGIVEYFVSFRVTAPVLRAFAARGDRQPN